MNPPSRRRIGPMAGVLTVVALASCTDDGASSPTVVPGTTTTTTTPERVDDGVLKIGVLLPESGPGATIGQPLVDAALAAGDAINAVGGVLGKPIELVTGFDEGDSVSTARDSIASLIDKGVDAVVGPASSTIALATLPDLLDAGILTCSPTATAMALDNFPDRDLFFRTAPSDSLQAVAMADEAERTGALTAAVVYLDDRYGRPLANATIEALQADNITVDEPIGFVADDDSLVDEAHQVINSDAGVIIVIGDTDHGTRMLSSIGEVTGVMPGEVQPTIIVNDAMRRPSSPQQIAQLAPDVRARIIGLAPSATGGLPDEPPGAYATNAYDCVNLIALASAQATSDDPAAIAAQMVSVSDGGVTCRLFAECVDLMAQVPNVNYEGPGGQVQLGSDGDPAWYRFDTWGYDEQGIDYALASSPIPVNRS
jgi:branched-chain amino acid transport system substrate-binding protein